MRSHIEKLFIRVGRFLPLFAIFEYKILVNAAQEDNQTSANTVQETNLTKIFKAFLTKPDHMQHFKFQH